MNTEEQTKRGDAIAIVATLLVAIVLGTVYKNHQEPGFMSRFRSRVANLPIFSESNRVTPPTHELDGFSFSRINGVELSEGERIYLPLLLLQHGATMSPSGGMMDFLPSIPTDHPHRSSSVLWYIEGHQMRFRVPFKFRSGESFVEPVSDRHFAEQAVSALAGCYKKNRCTETQLEP